MVATPWLVGGVEAETQAWLFAGVGFALLCLLRRQLAAGATAMSLPRGMVLLLLAVAFGTLQLLSLPPQSAEYQALLRRINHLRQ